MTDSRAAEAQGATTATFEFRGETFAVPLEYDDYPLSFIEAASDGKPAAIQARELLGPDQWGRVRDMSLKGREIQELIKAIDDAMGESVGNSPASSD